MLADPATVESNRYLAWAYAALGFETPRAFLAFLGTAVLGFVVADMLFHEFPTYHEGQKSKVKAALVSTAALAALAERLGLGAHILLGRGEEKTGGRRKQALLADTCEALIAALYLDPYAFQETNFMMGAGSAENSNGGLTFNMVTRSGTNQLHGGAMYNGTFGALAIM